MSIIIFFLIIFFIFLILYQLFLENKKFEGYRNRNRSNQSEYMEYQPNALMLSQQNAGNIEVLRRKINDFSKVEGRVNTLETKYTALQEQVNSIGMELSSKVENIEEPNITGAIYDENPKIDDLSKPKPITL